jgi:hypothetical protein
VADSAAASGAEASAASIPSLDSATARCPRPDERSLDQEGHFKVNSKGPESCSVAAHAHEVARSGDRAATYDFVHGFQSPAEVRERPRRTSLCLWHGLRRSHEPLGSRRRVSLRIQTHVSGAARCCHPDPHNPRRLLSGPQLFCRGVRCPPADSHPGPVGVRCQQSGSLTGTWLSYQPKRRLFAVCQRQDQREDSPPPSTCQCPACAKFSGGRPSPLACLPPRPRSSPSSTSRWPQGRPKTTQRGDSTAALGRNPGQNSRRSGSGDESPEADIKSFTA